WYRQGTNGAPGGWPKRLAIPARRSWPRPSAIIDWCIWITKDRSAAAGVMLSVGTKEPIGRKFRKPFGPINASRWAWQENAFTGRQFSNGFPKTDGFSN